MMWRFRVHRPLLLVVSIVDVLLIVVLWIMEANGVSLNHWVVSVVTSWISANFVIIWRDGVN